MAAGSETATSSLFLFLQIHSGGDNICPCSCLPPVPRYPRFLAVSMCPQQVLSLYVPRRFCLYVSRAGCLYVSLAVQSLYVPRRLCLCMSSAGSVSRCPQQVLSLCVPSRAFLYVLLVLSNISLFMKVSFSPDVILSGSPGSKHQLTN